MPYKIPRWGEPGFQLVQKLTSSCLERCWKLAGIYMCLWGIIRCKTEQAVDLRRFWVFFSVCSFLYLSFAVSFSSIHRNTPHPEGVPNPAIIFIFYNYPFFDFTHLNNWQLITCTLCSLFYHVPSSSPSTWWATKSISALENSVLRQTAFFSHHIDQSGRSWKFVCTGSNKFSLKTRQ